MKPYLSVIIPCYNEEKNLQRGVLEEIEKYFKRQAYPSEVIISDDGSTDKSLAFTEKFAKYHSRFKLLRNKHAGKPFAVKAGLSKARGGIVLFTDMDQSTPIAEVEKLLPFFKEDYEVVIGSRGITRKDAPWYRQIMAWGFRTIRRTALLKEVNDTQCGFKALEKKAARKIFRKMQLFKETKKTHGWRVGAWDVEMLFVAQKLGFQIKEVIVNWQDRDISVSKGKGGRFVKESKEMFFEILRVKLNDWRGLYE